MKPTINNNNNNNNKKQQNFNNEKKNAVKWKSFPWKFIEQIDIFELKQYFAMNFQVICLERMLFVPVTYKICRNDVSFMLERLTITITTKHYNKITKRCLTSNKETKDFMF